MNSESDGYPYGSHHQDKATFDYDRFYRDENRLGGMVNMYDSEYEQYHYSANSASS